MKASQIIFLVALPLCVMFWACFIYNSALFIIMGVDNLAVPDSRWPALIAMTGASSVVTCLSYNLWKNKF